MSSETIQSVVLLLDIRPPVGVVMSLLIGKLTDHPTPSWKVNLIDGSCKNMTPPCSDLLRMQVNRIRLNSDYDWLGRCTL